MQSDIEFMEECAKTALSEMLGEFIYNPKAIVNDAWFIARLMLEERREAQEALLEEANKKDAEENDDA